MQQPFPYQAKCVRWLREETGKTFYAVGGAWRIADTILPRIRATGGEVFTYARVEEILKQIDAQIDSLKRQARQANRYRTLAADIRRHEALAHFIAWREHEVAIVTADHGNVEQMINLKTGDIDKDHTTNPVPFLLIANEFKFKALRVAVRDFKQLCANQCY